MKRFTVGTFFHASELRGRRLTASRINAYTSMFNPNWDGCIVYEIEAASGAEAKRIAVQRRLEHERATRPEPGKGQP